MKSLTVTIIDQIGLHARPASLLVQASSKFKSNIKLIAGEKNANLKSIMSVMALGIKQNQVITIEATGEDEGQVIISLEKIMKDNNLI